MSFQLISSLQGGGGTVSEFTFSSIPQTFTDLLLVCSFRSSVASYATSFPMYFNLNGLNYTHISGIGDGSSASSTNGSSALGVQLVGSTATSNTFSNATIYIPNYTSSSVKSYSIDQVTENNATNATQQFASGIWSDSAAITNISIQGSYFASFSYAALYGITKGSGGATVS